MQNEKQEIHTVFPCFPFFCLTKNLSLPALAYLFRASLEIPLALVLTKMDLINPISTQKPDGMKDGQPSQTMDYEKGNPLSEEVKKWLRDIGEESLLSTVANNFSVYNFFPVSSLGSSPRRTYSTYTCDSIKPYGVLDPLLWIFEYNHIVD